MPAFCGWQPSQPSQPGQLLSPDCGSPRVLVLGSLHWQFEEMPLGVVASDCDCECGSGSVSVSVSVHKANEISISIAAKGMLVRFLLSWFGLCIGQGSGKYLKWVAERAVIVIALTTGFLEWTTNVDWLTRKPSNESKQFQGTINYGENGEWKCAVFDIR